MLRFSHKEVLRLVAVFKLLKASALIVTGIGILKLLHRDVASTMHHWVALSGLDPGGRFISHLIERFTAIPHEKIRDLGVVSFAYAGLFLTEGIGLWMLKTWAEWFTVFITGSLVPVEIYELMRRPTAVRGALLVLNVAVVIYLVSRIVADRREAERKGGA